MEKIYCFPAGEDEVYVSPLVDYGAVKEVRAKGCSPLPQALKEAHTHAAGI